MTNSEAELLAKAQQIFGIREFRAWQRQLIHAALTGRDAIGVLPSGSGKSLAYRLASLFLPRSVVVISPRVTLATNQTNKLEDCNVLARGKLDIVYVTPERLHDADFMTLLAGHGCSLLVVDDAHCISQSSHDFRAAYANVKAAAAALGHPPVLALSAIATAEVERDIIEALGLRSPLRVRGSAPRKNLSFSVHRASGEYEKLTALSSLLSHETGSGLIYCATLASAQAVHEQLVAQGHDVGLYHDNLDAVVRETVEAGFSDGRYRMLVACRTSSRELNRPDIRFVIHYQLPDSIESYVQDVSRAGRDGNAARCALIFDPRDVAVQRFFLRQKQPPAAALEVVLEWLAPGSAEDVELLQGTVAARWRDVIATDLARVGWEARYRLPELYAIRHARELARLAAIIDYAERPACRTRELVRYLDGDASMTCGRCDICEAASQRVIRRSGRRGEERDSNAV